MSFSIETRYDRPRGCGYRRPGGLYFLGAGETVECQKLPAPVIECRCCGHEVSQTRGIQKIKPAMLWGDLSCGGRWCAQCKINRPDAYLMWVGDKFYTPAQFIAEANTYGEISKRIAGRDGRPMLPSGFVVGESAVLLAHPSAIVRFRNNGKGKLEPDHQPGVFMAFVPTRIEYVVRGDESDEHLQSIADHGVTLVRVVRCDANGEPMVEQAELEMADGEED